MVAHNDTNWYGHARVRAGEFDHLFNRYGSRQERPKYWNSAYAFTYGHIIIGVYTDPMMSIIDRQPGYQDRSRWWLGSYSHVQFSIMHEYWNRLIEVDQIEGMVYSWQRDSNDWFSRNAQLGEIGRRLKRARIERVRLMTFDDPFLCEEDRLAYLGEHG